jgi:hypothetical protein
MIKSLFDNSRDIYRTIEKVINYNDSQEARLKAEISEYIVTNNIDEQFEKLLTKMQDAMDAGGENEIGVWVSGFYGSGKSSFTKYLGLALDEHVTIDGIPFLQHLQNRMRRPQTRALLANVARRFPAAVIFLDLASNALAGATMEEVSTVLYFKVLQWAGYSRNLKVAVFERKLQKDGRYEEFKQKIKETVGADWIANSEDAAEISVQNNPLLVDSVIPEIAHEMYPQLFKTSTAFNTETKEYIQFENDRVREMLDIVREVSDKQYILFIIDEVGQYVASRSNLILNLDGLAKNLKSIGNGKVWIFGTAQQTLTEDDPHAALNSTELYKLKDRFPIQIDLESRDIKEICYERLLGKSPEGAQRLDKLFDQYGQALRHNTKLVDAKYYDADFTKESFRNLYPFLPAHFDILIHLLGALAKSTGGVGLRSAIKVIQDILIESTEGRTAVVEHPVGWLANTVTLYDALERDIRRAFPGLHKALEKVQICFSDSFIHQEVAKTVVVLQILGNIPVNVHNVASLMQREITAPSRIEAIEKVVAELIKDSRVPFGEQDGNLCFFSEKLNDIELERSQLTVRSMETRRIFSETLREIFNPLPSTRLNNGNGSLVVTTGIKFKRGMTIDNLDGESNTLQTIIELADATQYETVRAMLVDESRHHTSQYISYLVGRNVPEIEEKTAEIFRCREIQHNHKNDPDQDVKKYCVGQLDRATKLVEELKQVLKKCLAGGSLIFRGQTSAMESLDLDVIEACKKHLGSVAAQVYDRNAEAAARVETALAEKFLRNGNLKTITAALDPLGLVQLKNGTPYINIDYPALQSIRDYIDRNGTVEGRRLTEVFVGAPYGWSPDTLRYLIAALFVGSIIKLRISGREVTAVGQQAIDALKNNIAFKTIGVALRDVTFSNEEMALAAQRLTELFGETVIPLEGEIGKTATKNLPGFQSRFAPLGTKLAMLGLPGEDQVQSLIGAISNLLATDASDAPKSFGAEQSVLYDNLKWAMVVENEFNNGLEATIEQIREYRREIENLPDSGIPGQLRQDTSEILNTLKAMLSKTDFYQYAPDLNTNLTELQSCTRNAAQQMAESLKGTLKQAEADLEQLPEWAELIQEERNNALVKLEELQIEFSADLKGLKAAIYQSFSLQQALSDVKNYVVNLGKKYHNERDQAAKNDKPQEDKTKPIHSFKIPKKVRTIQQLEEVIQELAKLKNDWDRYSEIEISIDIED